MAEILSPGVFIEEVPSQAQVVQPVSTSTMGIIGGAERGPTDTATLVTSYEQYTRVFGGLLRDSRMPLAMAAYFANGGRRAYIVRIAAGDAAAADADLGSYIRSQVIAPGDGTQTAFTEADGVSFLYPSTPGVVVGDSLIVWRSAGTPAVAEPLRTMDDAASLDGDAAEVSFSGRVLPSGVTLGTADAPAIDPAAVTFTIATDTGAYTIDLASGGDRTGITAGILTATNAAGSTCTLDLATGIVSMTWDATEIPAAGAITISYTPTVQNFAVIDSAGTLSGAGTGTVSLVDGSWSLTATNAPIDGYDLLASYPCESWDLNPISVGTWANNVRVQITGNADYYSVTSNSYTRHDLSIQRLNTASGSYEIVESFEELDFLTTTSPQYFPDVINDLSDLISVTEPATNLLAPDLNGVSYSQVLGGGADSVETVSETLGALPVQPRSVIITYTDAFGAARTVTDDGSGNLVGDVGSGTNSIVYATGVVQFTSVTQQVQDNTLILCNFATAATSTVETSAFAGGTDGTYDAANFGRDQFSSSALLEVGGQGLYALNRVEDLLQVVIPDFAGDTLITGDLLDYVDGRATQPHGGDRFAILTVPQGSSAQEAVDYVRYDLGRFSKFAAIYWPWVKVADPLKDNRSVAFPPLAHVSGIYARTDQTRNVGKAPGGTVDGALRYITGLEIEEGTTQGERDTVYPNRINPLISSTQTGTAVWGVRTLAQESEWQYINARRLFMFVERSVYNSTFWIVFENNGPALWARIKAQVEGFLLNLFNEGMFAGTTPAQAFFVTCDETNNTEASINAGQVIIDVGIAPNKPAEFVRFRFQQKTLNS